MREILFRAKKIVCGKRTNEWGYGVPLMSNPNSELAYIKQLNSYKYQVDPETICQYTGLKDKNGTKIFEGDIVNMLNITDYPMQIKWSKKWARFIFYNLVDKTEMNLFTEQCEVIGNIYDNPELIKE